MTTVKYIRWLDEGVWLGFLQDFPDYRTQGATIEELEENLLDLYQALASGDIPAVRHVADLRVA